MSTATRLHRLLALEAMCKRSAWKSAYQQAAGFVDYKHDRHRIGNVDDDETRLLILLRDALAALVRLEPQS